MSGGDKIQTLFREAMADNILRYRLYYCPEQAIEGRGFDEVETNALLFGDFSRIDLNDETRSIAHRIYNEAPFAGEMPPETAAVNVFTLKTKNDPCV